MEVQDAVAKLLEACPFIRPHVNEDDFDLPTVVYGDASRLLRQRTLAGAEEDVLFDFFNRLADEGRPDILEILGTGAIEGFNDDAQSQRLAKMKLTGRALQMLEEFREGWGQPDYG